MQIQYYMTLMVQVKVDMIPQERASSSLTGSAAEVESTDEVEGELVALGAL